MIGSRQWAMATPTALIIGDSIRVGYQQYATNLLAARMSVRSEEVGTGNSGYFLEHLDEWLRWHRPTIMHANAGLHDIRRPHGGRLPDRGWLSLHRRGLPQPVNSVAASVLAVMR